MENGNGNKKILWLIAIVNILTLILLTGFIVMSWDVITTEKTSQQENQQQVSTRQQTPQAQQQTPPATVTPSGQQTDVVKCMQDCLKEGKQASECESKCGVTKSQTGGTTQGKCGDGVCGPAEKANPSLCPKDCK